jgi:hypothetical protein
MPTWAVLVAQVQADLQDRTGVFHTTAAVRTYLEQSELLLTLRRSLYERTQTLPLTSASPLYVIHTVFPDFIRPLRVTINGVALRWSSLASVGRLNRQWYQERKEIESVFMVGTELLGFSSLPIETSAVVTYLALPGAGLSPMIGQEWHHTMLKYAQAVALVKEGEYGRAQGALSEFLALAGIERDSRFLEGLSQQPAQNNTRQVERKADD